MRLPNLEGPSPVLDPEMLASLREIEEAIGEPDFIATLAARFVDEAPWRVQTIERGLRCGDAEQVARHAHTLVNSAGAIGALRVCTAARQLDCPGSIPPAAARMLGALQREIAAAVRACEPLRRAG